MPTGQYWAVNSQGGLLNVPYLTERFRSVSQPLFRLRQFCDVKEAVGKGRGDTWYFAKSGNVATAGGTVAETSTIPETNFTLSHGTGTIAEFGNSIPFTQKVEQLSKWDLENIIEEKLRDDAVKVLESACGAEYVKTDYVAVCVTTASTTITTNSTPAASATADLTASNVRDIVNFMKKKLIPKYDGQNYVCVASVQALSGLHSDVATGGWIDISKFTDVAVQNILAGEVGRFYGVRFVEETGYLSNIIGNGTAHGQALFFGADNVYEAVSIPEEIRQRETKDFQRDQALGWYALLGFKMVWNHVTDSEQHIVFVTSS